MIEVSIGQLVLYVLAAAALGAVIAVLSFTRGKQAAGAPPTSQAADTAVRDRSTDRAEEALTAAAIRHNRVVAFLKNRVTGKRTVTIDEAAKCLDVSPRRISRLLNDGKLMAIPVPGGSRLVSAVSVLDMVNRQEAALSQATQQAGVKSRQEEEQEEPEPEQAKPELQKEASTKAPATHKLPKPGPRQLYWYYVTGNDEPLSTIRDALQVLGLEYKYTGWTDIPAHIRKKIRRERV